MKQQAVTPTEIDTLIDLIRRTEIKYLLLERSDLDQLVPDNGIADDAGRLIINLHTRGLQYEIEENIFTKIDWLDDVPGVGGEVDLHQYYFELFNELNLKLGFDRMMAIISCTLDEKIEALSTGQSEAFLKKLIIRARDDGKTLNSTTRSQLQQIKDKITKYQPFIDYISPYFIDNRLPQYLQTRLDNGQTSLSTILSGKEKDIMAQKEQLRKTPPRLEEKDEEELIKIREAAIQQGLYRVEELDEEKYYFLCKFCKYTKELDSKKPVTEQQEEHHGKPMVLRVTRTKGSDF